MDMWYVIQTLGGEEERAANMIRRQIPHYYMEECFVPKRERMKKFHGSWNKVEEILFRGYVFVASQTPERLYQELKKIPKLTKMLGREKDIYFPLNELEERMVRGIGDKEHKTVLSKIEIDEGKQIRVTEGPLKDYVRNVVRVNLHKREVAVQVKFMGKTVELFMGVELVNE
ncbi:antiterminator LoaP [Clostridiaceae bacterium]|nr:antiterminator LoaP [Clostridiaceae bacterium]RKI12936.1 antiterminator LoaP [bacterium 1XD21-70]